MPGQAGQTSIAIIALTRSGSDLALRLQSRLPDSACYVPSRQNFAVAMGATGFGRLNELFPELWFRHHALVCIMATGIVVRHIAPLLRHKTEDPAVVVLDERGQFVISLVSGHAGGANRLAREVARLTGGQPVITTASDVQGKPALDVIARKAGLEIENSDRVARLMRAILEDEPIWIYDPERRLKKYLKDYPGVRWVVDDAKLGCPVHTAPLSSESGRELRGLAFESIDGTPSPSPYRHGKGIQMLPQTAIDSTALGERGQGGERRPQPPAGPGIWVSERSAAAGLYCLKLRPRNLVVGIGCNRGTAAAEILELVRQVFQEGELSLLSIRNLASVDLKADEPGLLEAARALGRPIQFCSREEIDSTAVPNPSEAVAKHIGVRSVCEATALLSASREGRGVILIPKQKTVNVTVAVARVAFPS
jgi:cobalt-precorrin 5A hydrolase